MANGEIAALKQALCDQYIIIKKLYVELEEEREASASAATEALSMILRLQREKAAEKMEACQYKRMAEERIHHAEGSLEMLEEVVQQKDLEIESLRFQLKGNKQKQTNLPVSIPNFGEMMQGESKSCCNGIFRRNASLPSLRGDEFCSEKGFLDDESTISTSGISVWRIGDFANRHIKTTENDVDDLFEELAANKGMYEWKYEPEEVSKRVEELKQVTSSTFDFSSSVATDEVQSTSSPIGSTGSWFSAPFSDVSTESTKRSKGMKSNDEAISISPSQYKVNENPSSLQIQFSGNVKYSALFHDIFEVPESHKGCKPGELCKKLLQDTILETNSMNETPNMKPKEAPDYILRDDGVRNKAFMGSKLSIPGEEAIISKVSKTCTPKKVTSVNYQSDLLDPGDQNATSYSDIEQLRGRLQRLEDERIILQKDSESGKKQLREILKQLNTIETCIKKSTSRKSSPKEESSLVSIMEAVLSFSI